MGLMSPETTKKMTDIQLIDAGMKQLASVGTETMAAKPIVLKIADQQFKFPNGEYTEKYLELFLKKADEDLVEISAKAAKELSGKTATDDALI